MDQEKQNKPEEKNICRWLCKKDVLKRVIVGLAGLVIISLIFGLGVFVGGMKARFSYRWAENYQKNFGGPRDGFIMNDWRKFPSGDFIESRGAFGKIIKINDSDLVVKGKGNTEKVIIITEKTAIEKGRKTIKKEELKVDDSIVVIGSPNEQGQIEAKLIRVFNAEDAKKTSKHSWLRFFR